MDNRHESLKNELVKNMLGVITETYLYAVHKDKIRDEFHPTAFIEFYKQVHDNKEPDNEMILKMMTTYDFFREMYDEHKSKQNNEYHMDQFL